MYLSAERWVFVSLCVLTGSALRMVGVLENMTRQSWCAFICWPYPIQIYDVMIWKMTKERMGTPTMKRPFRCVCVCVCLCVRARMCVYVCVKLCIWQAIFILQIKTKDKYIGLYISMSFVYCTCIIVFILKQCHDSLVRWNVRLIRIHHYYYFEISQTSLLDYVETLFFGEGTI